MKIIIFAAMKYIIRAIKYFLYVSCLMAIILFALAKLRIVDGSLATMFRNGYDSLWQLALAFLAVSAIYPKFGYVKRGAVIPGAYSEIRDDLVSFMAGRGYRLEKEDGENLSFRSDSFPLRLMRVFEDRISFSRDLAGFYVEGPAKDVVRLISGLEYRFRTPAEK